MSEAEEIIRKLNTEQRNYLNRYFAHAPESVTGSMQVVRMPEGMTFIQEGMPVDKVYVLLKGCVSAVDYRVRETVYGFCHFNPIETFGAMEILGHMDQYRTTLATTSFASSKYAAIFAQRFGSPGRITYFPTSPSPTWI